MSMFSQKAKWITDKSYVWPKKTSPIPMVFRKKLALRDGIKQAVIRATALGIYELELDGVKVGEDYFAPGFTSYRHQIQVQTYDVTELLKADSTVTVTVAGGWAAGSFHYNRTSHIMTNHPSLLLELAVEYEDGTKEAVPTDGSWQVTEDGPVRLADWYDGETFDATVSLANARWRQADVVKIPGKPKLLPQYGDPVRVRQVMEPVSCTEKPDGKLIYDFGQNFAGVICARISGHAGQRVIFRHAEVLDDDGDLYTEPLRTAKATAAYLCREGVQTYSPRFTYMGFRYVEVSGVHREDIQLTAYALYSDFREIGSFACSDERLNRLNENIRWSGRSNFVDIPTDCPQRDERLGWTGDIAIFAQTACYNFDMSRFFGKWLKDLSAEQSPFGSLPMVAPRNGDPFPKFTTACWGDSCILVPWAEYLARGDLDLLREYYPTMRRFLKSVKRWAGLFSLGKKRYIWKWLFQFGDWCAPLDPPEPYPQCRKTWMSRGPWIATAYWANSCGIMAQIAGLLGKEKDAEQYKKLREKICNAYRDVFTDGNGKLKNEFQTAYILPLHFGMAQGGEAENMAANLAALAEKNGYRLTTGFPSTPYLLFALSDHGQTDTAYKMLMQEEAPSWLYAVKAGATTVWEQWEAMSPDGKLGPNRTCSQNHYAYGAVGNWLYQRVLGVEPTSGGYKTFRVAPVLGGGLTWAEGGTETPYGPVHVRWDLNDKTFTIKVTVPQKTECALVLPGGKTEKLTGGEYEFSEEREEAV